MHIKTISSDRIRLAIEASKSHELMNPRHPGHEGLTIDMLACELQRIECLLTGETYYDYEQQQWIKD
ncbi:MAG: hypothetical protein GY941_21755 [Planctomycetes bacterium]|nr:hypothetical protein [Planctomycetota bacterium]